ncbi:Hypothetical protein NTJ_06367 [Nesidiocoris tenuis]|uniref:Uncharacterized protein n=1 Tax=Nesidiocoris tenuis TaxID=355587 RepID=A0ABN7ANB6_9HEMI|nr:Hypothetical protein NTJ_06367 [Nesidiocoris tenuis]
MALPTYPPRRISRWKPMEGILQWFSVVGGRGTTMGGRRSGALSTFFLVIPWSSLVGCQAVVGLRPSPHHQSRPDRQDFLAYCGRTRRRSTVLGASHTSSFLILIMMFPVVEV